MIAKSGVKVLDFGLAKSGQDETVTGQPHGDGHACLHGAGAARRQTGRCPLGYLFVRLRALRNAHRRSASRPQRRRIPSRKLERIVSRCLEEDPARRWQSVAELERELAGVNAAGSAWKRIACRRRGCAGCCSPRHISISIVPRNSPTRTRSSWPISSTTRAIPIFDGTLRQGLAIQLEQSPFLKIMDDEQVRRVLRLMSLRAGRPHHQSRSRTKSACAKEPRPPSTARSRAWGKATSLTLQAITCQDGATLAREQIQAEDKEHVLNALGTAATAMRGKLGESLNSIQKLSRPLEQATTPSLEALQNYTAGRSELSRADSLPLFRCLSAPRTSIRISRSAYYRLGVAYEVPGTWRAARNTRKRLSL